MSSWLIILHHTDGFWNIRFKNINEVNKEEEEEEEMSGNHGYSDVQEPRKLSSNKKYNIQYT